MIDKTTVGSGEGGANTYSTGVAKGNQLSSICLSSLCLHEYLLGLGGMAISLGGVSG